MKQFLIRGFVLAAVFACGCPAHAQSVISEPDVDEPLEPAALRDPANPNLWSQFGELVESLRPIQWGVVTIAPDVSDRYIYSDGLQARPGSKTDSYINTFAPGLRADIGSNWSVRYRPSWVNYSNDAFSDTFEQTLNITGAQRVADWYVRFSQTYNETNSPDIQTGSQTGRELSVTNFTVSHRFTNNLSFDLGATQTLRFIESAPDSYDWSTNGWINYRFISQLDVAVGASVGYTDFDPGSNMVYYTPQVRVRWQPGKKLSFEATAGQEYRKIHTTGLPARNTPVYSAAAFYRPFDQTRMTFRAERSIAPSYITNGTSDNTSFNFNLQQRLFGHYTFTGSIGRTKSHFLGTRRIVTPVLSTQNVFDSNGNLLGTLTTVTFVPSDVVDERHDSSRSYRFRISTPFLNRGTFSVLYQVRRNESDTSGFAFNSHQVGGEIAYRF
ncbi:MAG: hypothetical protein JWM32_550 [Verrucomicrobia bacterium]|nr:hypothetical protein [Verrucomicrobiota bacterium]